MGGDEIFQAREDSGRLKAVGWWFQSLGYCPAIVLVILRKEVLLRVLDRVHRLQAKI